MHDFAWGANPCTNPRVSVTGVYTRLPRAAADPSTWFGSRTALPRAARSIGGGASSVGDTASPSMGRHLTRILSVGDAGPEWSRRYRCEWGEVVGGRVRRLREAYGLSLARMVGTFQRPDGGHYSPGVPVAARARVGESSAVGLHRARGALRCRAGPFSRPGRRGDGNQRGRGHASAPSAAAAHRTGRGNRTSRARGGLSVGSAAIQHPHGLALTPRDLARRHPLDGPGHAGVIPQRGAPSRGQSRAINAVVGRLARHRELVEGAVALDDQLVVGGKAIDPEQHMLDLGRIQVYAADDEHVVAPAAHGTHPGERSATGAGLVRKRGDVAGAVAQQG